MEAPPPPPPDNHESPETLMRRAATCHDTRAFGEVIRALQGRVLAFASRMLGGDTDAARDIAQEAFLRLWQARGTFAATVGATAPPLLSYLLRVTRNLCHDHHRQQRLRRTIHDEQAIDAAPDHHHPPPDARLRADALHEAVRRALAELPEEQKVVFVLSHYDGMAYREIAALLECPMGTVASRKHLAVEHLRRRLNDVKDWMEP